MKFNIEKHIFIKINGEYLKADTGEELLIGETEAKQLYLLLKDFLKEKCDSALEVCPICSREMKK